MRFPYTILINALCISGVGSRMCGGRCGSPRCTAVEVITYCAMQSHAHILVRVDPAVRQCGDAELAARFEALYGASRAAWCRLNAREPKAVLAEGPPRARRSCHYSGNPCPP